MSSVTTMPNNDENRGETNNGQQTQQQQEEDLELVLLAQSRRNQRSRERRVPTTRAPPSVTMATISNVFPEELKNVYLSAGSADMQGRRPTMEDACVVEVHYRTSPMYTQYSHLSTFEETFVGVYDGHGGTEASKFVGAQLHEIFKSKLALFDDFLQKRMQIEKMSGVAEEDSIEELFTMSSSMVSRLKDYLKLSPTLKDNEASSDNDDDDDDDEENEDETIEQVPFEMMSEEQLIPHLLRESFLETNHKLCYEEKIKNGTTASVAYIRPVVSTSDSPKVTHRLYTANVGDSRIVLCRSGKAHRLVVEHRPNDPDEQRRVKDAGGYVINHRVNAILAVTRAIGDVYLQPMVSPDPFTAVVNLLSEDEFIIVACDGVWDVIDDQAAVDLIREETDPRVASCKLRDEAYARGSTDNITVVVIRVNNNSNKD